MVKGGEGDAINHYEARTVASVCERRNGGGGGLGGDKGGKAPL